MNPFKCLTEDASGLEQSFKAGAASRHRLSDLAFRQTVSFDGLESSVPAGSDRRSRRTAASGAGGMGKGRLDDSPSLLPPPHTTPRTRHSHGSRAQRTANDTPRGVMEVCMRKTSSPLPYL